MQKRSITTVLIVVISAFYLVAAYFPAITGWNLPLQQQLFLIRSAVFPDGSAHGVDHGEYYRLITVALTHGSLTHLLFNMVALFQLGTSVEAFYGRLKYGFILFASLLAGSAASYIFNPPNMPAVGASGMIFGLFGALVVTGKRMGVDYRAVGGVIVINLLITFIVPNIDWHAHIGGMAGGALATYLVIMFNRPQKRLRNI